MSLGATPVRHDLACIDVTAMRGLEIGPLTAPRVRKSEGDVLYVDHMDAEGLRRKYADDPILHGTLDHIVDIDYVMSDGRGIPDVVGDHAPFDYVVAAHLIEHIPDPITWLMDLAAVLRPGGILSLVVPDKRFTFDINRRTTEIGDLVDAYLRKLRTPSFQQAYDFISREVTVRVEPAEVWAGAVDFTGVVRSDVPDPDVAALQLCRTMAESDTYVDLHCSVFTPDSFLELFEKLSRLSLMEFEIAHFVPTERNQLEFHVSLRRLDTNVERTSIIEQQLASVSRALLTMQDDFSHIDHSQFGTLNMMISPREWTLITAKRRVLERVRTLRR